MAVEGLFSRAMKGEKVKSCNELLKAVSEEVAGLMDEEQGLYREEDIWAVGRSLLAGKELTFSNYQKKMSPLEEELALFRGGREKASSELVVVASLLEKIPNFGHLVRTCEVFGVKALAIPDLRLLENEEFKKVSVTGEKWLNIQEVKAPDVASYMALMKAAGYEIVGLEQTQSSVPLQDFTFSKKSVLLLGN